MTAYVALFRGINVAGKHILPMRDLREILAALGCENIVTYIQSGNAVFLSRSDAAELAAAIAAAVKNGFGFAPRVLVLSVDRFASIAAANPYRDAEQMPRSLHVWFLTDAPVDPDLDTLTELRTGNERFTLGDGAFYLFAPDGIGRSKLAAKVDRCLGVETTARNWNTVSKLLDLV